MATVTSNKSKQAVGSILPIMAKAKIHTWQPRIKLFASMALSVLSNSIPVWSLRYLDVLERVQLNFLKRVLLVPSNTPDAIVRLETGRVKFAHSDYRNERYDESFTQYALLSELGYEAAQSNAAFMLDRGEVPMFTTHESLVRALLFWGRAAAQGYSAAQVKLGDYYYYGLGTPVDFEMAATHYRLASDQQHNAQAMFNLGYMHERGLGMEQDMHLAKRLYDRAADTSSDAKVPVALALLKLNVLFGVESIHEEMYQIK
ncbi:unnamed protein product [Phaedon cochleariae]|uniref:Uncharacterized protein n=1 Tax=Phaedon cochleariae TaxID=80249 RepID=A0A9P0GM73_PHACE|nr:unnamed protein product [Phaedon cochleariae]